MFIIQNVLDIVKLEWQYVDTLPFFFIKLAIFMLQTLISSDEFNVSDVKVVWYKNGTHKTRRRNI